MRLSRCCAVLATAVIAAASSAHGQAIGACCILAFDGDPFCFETTASDCASRGGFYEGDGTACDDPLTCPPLPRGACCLLDGSCVETNLPDCVMTAGRYQGDGTSCAAGPCAPMPTGACCVSRAGVSVCVEATAFDCLLVQGRYQGDDTTCPNAACAPACACDADGDGDADVLDLLSFLGAFFDRDADFNGDGTTDVRDLLAFLQCFFDGCP